MRRLLTIAALLAASLACDPMPEDSTYGVQIGSEGLIDDCALRTVTPDEVLDGFSVTAQEAAEGAVGELDAALSGVGAGTLELAAESLQTAADPECARGLALRTTARLDLDPALMATLTGWIVLDDGATGVLWAATDTWAGTTEPTLDPGAFDTFELLLQADFNGGGYGGRLAFEGCIEADCELENLGAFSAE